MPGPPPIPTEILKIRGSRLPGRRGNEPKPQIEAPDCPEWLPQLAREEWDRLVPQLLAQRLLTKLDQGALASLCVAYSMIVQCQRVIDEEGMTYWTANGAIVKRPEVGILVQAQATHKAYLQQFGMTPASRAGVNAPTSEKKSSGVASRKKDAS